eukprot:GABV01009975.1.p1 GENE.GABV01009975.1~~GABV01009975.1.p1  ORF type:complete len:169 (-),score=48.43 GABV01009975.1:55-489(-)
MSLMQTMNVGSGQEYPAVICCVYDPAILEFLWHRFVGLWHEKDTARVPRLVAFSFQSEGDRSAFVHTLTATKSMEQAVRYLYEAVDFGRAIKWVDREVMESALLSLMFQGQLGRMVYGLRVPKDYSYVWGQFFCGSCRCDAEEI